MEVRRRLPSALCLKQEALLALAAGNRSEQLVDRGLECNYTDPDISRDRSRSVLLGIKLVQMLPLGLLSIFLQSSFARKLAVFEKLLLLHDDDLRLRYVRFAL